MALRSNSTFLRSMLRRLTRNPTFATSTTPKMKPQAAPADLAHHPEKVAPLKLGAFVPVYVAIGMITLQLGFGAFTVVHQLKRCPNVSVKKSRRETLRELVEPEHAAEEGEKFIKGSFFRKLAHIQDTVHESVIPDPIRGDVYTWQQRPQAITLKDVGVDPAQDMGVDPRSLRH